ncbi:MAG: VanW family protein [Candidatus Kerfeldbacteria bacterium]|nr:VanW family protein [Candidatus Kerfeldbacteria bacterium]
MPQKTPPKKPSHLRPFPIACGLLVGIVVVLAVLVIYDRAYRGRIYPGVAIGNTEVGGKTPEAVLADLDERTSDVLKTGLVFQTPEATVTIPAAIATQDFSYDILAFDHNASVNAAYAFGRQNDTWTNIRERLSALVFDYTVPPSSTFDEQEFLSVFSENVQNLETPKVDAELMVKADGSLDIQPEKSGQAFVRKTLVSRVENQIWDLSFDPLPIALETDVPAITEQDAQPLLPSARGIAARAPLTLTFEDKKWEVGEAEVSTWLALRTGDKGITLDLRQDHVDQTLDRLRPEVDVEAKNGKFSISDGKVSEFQQASVGRTVDSDETFAALRTLLLETTDTTASLVVTTLKPEVAGEINPAEFGIVELLGTGHTNFRGSPPNRIHNITNGATILNGLLVKPGDEFSLVTSLLPFDTDHGWKEELVIKGNRTIPEVGGGGCQLGTTFFRAALNSAMPITARRNHSYIVSYYYDEEGKPGKDATIYDPQPDFRFKNDTGKYVLIQTRIEGFDFYVDFWGTEDGRSQVQTSTVVTNWTNPEPPKTIKTTDIPPGERKQLEKAHKGASTSFDYIITYPEGTQDTTTFASKYKAWQEVWLEGVTPEEFKADQEKEQKPS